MENNDSSSNSSSDDIIDRVFFKKYHCIKKLGEGSFGRIYEGVYNNEHFALKFEDTKTDSNLLESEAGIMNYLKSKYIPSIHSFGRSGDYNILIMQLMGQSLEDLINIKKTFPIKTVCLLGTSAPSSRTSVTFFRASSTSLNVRRPSVVKVNSGSCSP